MRKRNATITDKRTSVPSFMDFKGKEKLLKSTNLQEASDKKRKSVYETREKHSEKDLKLKSAKSVTITEEDQIQDLNIINEAEFKNIHNKVKEQKKLLEEKDQEIKKLREKYDKKKKKKKILKESLKEKF